MFHQQNDVWKRVFLCWCYGKLEVIQRICIVVCVSQKDKLYSCEETNTDHFRIQADASAEVEWCSLRSACRGFWSVIRWKWCLNEYKWNQIRMQQSIVQFRVQVLHQPFTRSLLPCSITTAVNCNTSQQQRLQYSHKTLRWQTIKLKNNLAHIH